MSQIPAELKYIDTHQWLRQEADGSCTIGITDFAQETLGDIVYVELPAPGSALKAGTAVALVESVKSASDVYSPIDGTVLAINDALVAAPELANSEPYAAAWFLRITPSNPAQIDSLLDAAAYGAAIGV